MRDIFEFLKRALLHFVIAFCVFFTVGAQHSSMTLEECMRFGIQHNLDVKTARFNAGTARNNYVAGIGSFLPEVEAEGTVGKRFGRSVDPETNAYTSASFIESNVGLNIALPLFEGFMRMNKLKFESLNKRITSLEIERAKNGIAYRVMLAFYKIQMDDHLLEHTREQRKLTEQYIRQMDVLLSLGLKSPTDMQELKARLNADLYQETFRENSLQMSLLSLKHLLNLSETDSLSLQYPSETQVIALPVHTPADSVYHVALAILPEAEAMDLKIEAARKSLSIARGTFSPVLCAEYSLYSGYYDTQRDELGNVVPFSTQIRDKLGHYIGLKLTIPVFSGLKRITTLRNERLNLSRMETQIQQQRQSLQAEIENACLSLCSAAQEYFKAKEQLEANRLTLKNASRKWEEGLISVFELMEIRNRYIASAAELTRTTIQYDIQNKAVRFYTTGSFFNN